MAGKNTDEIVVGANGRILVAPSGTAGPSAITADFSNAWTDLGFASEDGVTIRDAKTVEDIPVWQLFYAARKIVTERSFELAFVLRQWNKDTLILGFGGGTVTQPVAGTYEYTPPSPEDLDDRAAAVEWLDGTKKYRVIVSKATVTETVESVVARTAAADIPITLSVVGQEGVNPFKFQSNDAALTP